MGWPNPQEYTKAIGSPAVCFSDPDLAHSVAQVNGPGTPKFISGNFANVYQLNKGDKSWAVKCFLRNVRDQSERYTAIQKHFARFSTENTIGFEFLERGINVAGAWYPIVKMDWVSGDTLDAFILTNGHNPRFISWLADQFKQMTLRLHNAGIAHGDLHHGNVLVAKTGLKLVDYDGAFVPTLSSLPSSELGHHNYQHPKRTVVDFGKHLDNFSSWVIYTSLICLSHDPELWQTLAGGDECLLFRSADFGDPQSSYAFSMLEQHEKSEVRAAASALRALCDLPLDMVPLLDQTAQRSSALPPLKTSINLPRWIPKQEEAHHHSGDARAFPNFRSYNETMRSPVQAFADPELQEGFCLLEDTKVGANGRVYHFICPGRDIAVKCFAADVPGRYQRYQEICRTQFGPAQNFMVPCEYIARGVYVNGEWYPIVKMPWVKGYQVNEVPGNLRTDALFSYVADQFAAMVSAFAKAGIAHGDIEFANLIVDTEQYDLRIVDYDNLFVPALTRLGSLELGHPGFQSPRRKLADYGPYVDNFSAWVVHYMLKNLTLNPRLNQWLETCLDEERVGSTAHTMLRAMENDRDAEVRQFSSITRLLLARPLHLLPELQVDTRLEDIIANQSKEVTKPGQLLKKKRW